MRVNAFVFLRSSSSRLPAKHSRRIGNNPDTSRRVLTILRQNISKVKFDSVVMCIPNEDVEYIQVGCAEYGLHRTPTMCLAMPDETDDLIARMQRAARLYPADAYAIISGDCPLLSDTLIMDMIDLLDKNRYYDYVTLPNGHPHQGVDIIKHDSLMSLGSSPHLSFKLHPQLKYIELLELFEYPNFKSSVDTHADLAFLNECHRLLGDKPLNFMSVCNLVEEYDYLTHINLHCKTKGLYQASLKYLLITYGDSEWGMGHIARTIANAQILSEYSGFGVTIAINNNPLAIKFIEDRGYRYRLDYFFDSELNNDSVTDFDCTMQDTPWNCHFSGYDYIDSPTLYTNERLDWLQDSLAKTCINDIVVSFGMGKYRELVPKIIDHHCYQMDYVIADGKSDIYSLMVNANEVITMWSQTAREALRLGKTVFVYTDSKADADICAELSKQGVLIWLGDINEL